MGLRRTLLIISLIAEILCLAGSIFIVASLGNDTFGWMCIILFACAIIFTILTLIRSSREG